MVVINRIVQLYLEKDKLALRNKLKICLIHSQILLHSNRIFKTKNPKTRKESKNRFLSTKHSHQEPIQLRKVVQLSRTHFQKRNNKYSVPKYSTNKTVKLRTMRALQNISKRNKQYNVSQGTKATPKFSAMEVLAKIAPNVPLISDRSPLSKLLIEDVPTLRKNLKKSEKKITL